MMTDEEVDTCPMMHLAIHGFGYTRVACTGKSYDPANPITFEWTTVDCPECQVLINTANVSSRLRGQVAPFRETVTPNGTTLVIAKTQEKFGGEEVTVKRSIEPGSLDRAAFWLMDKLEAKIRGL